MIKLNAKELRTTSSTIAQKNVLKKNPIYIIVDNVLDTYNVGSIFRLADAVAAEKVYLCGQTLTPPNSRIKKASVNTWQYVDWEYFVTAKEAIGQFRACNKNGMVYAVEQDERSRPFNTVDYTFPLAIIVGNESNGISKEV